jgi:hypothetical protein
MDFAVRKKQAGLSAIAQSAAAGRMLYISNAVKLCAHLRDLVRQAKLGRTNKLKGVCLMK